MGIRSPSPKWFVLGEGLGVRVRQLPIKDEIDSTFALTAAKN